MSQDGSRKGMREAVLIVAAAVLAMQFALAAQACVLPLSALRAAAVTAPCAGSGMNSGMSSAACLIQCQKTADQIKPTGDVSVDALPPSFARPDGSATLTATCAASTGSPLVLRSVGPPLQILFCSFQS